MDKRINKFDSIFDMGTFPWSVHLGASVNIVFTIWLTSLVFGTVDGEVLFLLPFAVFLIALNLAPVIVLRGREDPYKSFPIASEMNFFKDQHRFASWVYAIASGNMFFWITVSWCVFSISYSNLFIIGTQVFAFTVTYVPLWRSLCKRLNIELF